MKTLFSTDMAGALFSNDRKHRFMLWRIWDETKPRVMFIGLNPSNANESDPDPTIQSVGRISKFNGFGGFYMLNLFSFVTPYPEELQELSAHQQANDHHLSGTSIHCSTIVYAWGRFDVAKERGEVIKKMFPTAKVLGLNKNGSPKHPLFQREKTELKDYPNT